MKNELIYQYFCDDDFLGITKSITKSELTHSGEIRVAIKEKRPFVKRKTEIKKLAEEEFYKLGMDKTRDKTGVLFYFSLKEKEFYILADEGINSKVDQKEWDDLAKEIMLRFKTGEYVQGIVDGIEKAGKKLSEFFPIKSDDTNEISNGVIF